MKRVEITMRLAAFLVPIAEIVSIIINTVGLPTWARAVGACIGVCGGDVSSADRERGGGLSELRFRRCIPEL